TRCSSFAPGARRWRRPTSSWSSARRSTSGWVTASAWRPGRRSSRLTSTPARSASTGVWTSASPATPPQPWGNSPTPARGGRRAWLGHLRAAEQKALEKDLPLLNSDAVPIHPLRLAREINDFLTDESIFIGDGGDVVTFSASAIQTRRPGQWLDPGPLGTLGVGMPFAIAAKVAYPKKDAFILFGDGAFGLNGFEFDTAGRLHLPAAAGGGGT